MAIEISDKDFAELLKERAIAGDPEFLHRVGECYRWGNVVEENYAEGLKWSRLAAEKGHEKAQNRLGYAYDVGQGVVQDKNMAIIWYKLSAERGYAPALYNLARCYETGDGVLQDFDEALWLYKLSTEQGNWAPSYALGLMYHYGKGVEIDFTIAKMYYEMALADMYYKDAPAGEADIKNIRRGLAEVNALLEEEEKERQAKAEADAKAARIAARTQVFISYAHADMQETSYVNELRTHLKTLQRTREIEWWDDTKIKPGEKWDEKIQEALARAKVVVLMVSADFIASEYVWNKELPKILEAAREEGATVLWLLVSACDYEDTDIAAYQAVTPPDRSLAMRRMRAERDEVYTALVKRIKEIFKAAPAR